MKENICIELMTRPSLEIKLLKFRIFFECFHGSKELSIKMGVLRHVFHYARNEIILIIDVECLVHCIIFAEVFMGYALRDHDCIRRRWTMDMF